MGQVVAFVKAPPPVSIAKKKPTSDRSRKRSELTTKDRFDAMLLKQAWATAEREGAKISKKELASIWGKSHGLVSQYINGHTALNVEAQLQFARYLKRLPTDIWPDFQFADMIPGRLPADAIEVALSYMRVEDDSKPYAKGILDRLPKKQ